MIFRTVEKSGSELLSSDACPGINRMTNDLIHKYASSDD